MLSHILGVSLPPSACSNPLCRHPPPSSEGGEGTPVPCTELDLLSKLGVNAVTGRGYNPSVFCCCKAATKSSSLVRGSRGGYRRRPQMLPKCKPQVSPPGRAALIRHGAAQKRSTAPPSPRGRRGGCRRKPQNCKGANRRSSAAGGAKAVFPKGKGFSPHKFAVFVAPGRVFCYNTFNNTQNAQKGLFV